MKNKFDLTEAFVIVDNYGEGNSVDGCVYINGEEAERACTEYNIDKSFQKEATIINILDYGEAQYSRGSSNAMYM